MSALDELVTAMDSAARARFWMKVRVSPAGVCWEWVAGKCPGGYGKFGLKGHSLNSHRVAYVLAGGQIPAGLYVDHLCRNRACVNPDHMEPVTNGENVLRGESFSAVQARRTHCPRGHAYDEANTWLSKKNERHCRACNRERYHEYKQVRAARSGAES